MAEQFSQIKLSMAEQFRQLKRSFVEQIRQIKCSLAEPQYVVEARAKMSLAIMSKIFGIWMYQLILRVIEESVIGLQNFTLLRY